MKENDQTTTPQDTTQSHSSLVVMDLGKVSSKKIRDLKKGTGKLIGEVTTALAAAQEEVKTGQQIVPIVFIYQKKEGKNKLFRPFR